ncbi:hypothetical protein PseBG33_2310 [Pseudomonas synxantha BG33R]|nr:hypothetical protein PseBG33_2310 [Pseudomonas synxantha BG33R]
MNQTIRLTPHPAENSTAPAQDHLSRVQPLPHSPQVKQPRLQGQCKQPPGPGTVLPVAHL